MDEIKEFKKNNGNVTYKVKELLGAIHVKLDRIEIELKAGSNKFTDIESSSKWHTRLIWSIFGLLGGLLMLTLKITKVI